MNKHTIWPNSKYEILCRQTVADRVVRRAYMPFINIEVLSERVLLGIPEHAIEILLLPPSEPIIGICQPIFKIEDKDIHFASTSLPEWWARRYEISAHSNRPNRFQLPPSGSPDWIKPFFPSECPWDSNWAPGKYPEAKP